MVFAHDTETALLAAAALINSADPADDKLPDLAALDAFLAAWGWTGRRENTLTELHAVHALRPRLRELWFAPEDEVVEIVNGMLRAAAALPQLVKHDGWDYHLHAIDSDAQLSVRMAVEAAMAFIDVVRGKELSRLRTCDYPGCDNVLIDLSKNRSKRFCDDGCGNRAAVAAYRARKAANK